MSRNLLQQIIWVILVTGLIAGCAGAPVTPVAEAPAETATLLPPTATLVPASPTATSTLIPLTATPIDTPTVITPTQQQAKAEIENFMLNSQALASNLLNDPAERPVQVLLPPGYATSGKRYPVVYFLHRYRIRGDVEAFPTLQFWWKEHGRGDIVTGVEQGIQLGETQEMILVFPNAGNKFLGSMYLSSPTIGDYETYLTKELVDYVDSHYRTLPQRESRGISGCSMGGDGAAHLGLKYPDVYAVAVAQSGTYFGERDPILLEGQSTFYALGLAAAVAPNANKPPLYLDDPYVEVNGKSELAPGFLEKVKASDPSADVERYLAQPVRLNALLVQHSQDDPFTPVELAQDFDELLTQKGITHEFDDSFSGHCSYDMVPPMLKFMSDNLAGEEVGQ